MRKMISTLSVFALICAMAVNAFAVTEKAEFHCGDSKVIYKDEGYTATYDYEFGVWVLDQQEVVCPFCGQTEWSQKSNNGNGGPSGGNVQFWHNRPVVEEELITVEFVGFCYDTNYFGPTPSAFYFGGGFTYPAPFDAPVDWARAQDFYGDAFVWADYWLPGMGVAIGDGPLSDYAVLPEIHNVIYIIGIIVDYVVDCDADVSVTVKNGNTNDMTISVTEFYASGKTNVISETLSVPNNFKDEIFNVGDYTLSVTVLGNTNQTVSWSWVD